MKTITISDEVYKKLVSIKGDKTFSQVIDELIMRDIDKRVEKIIEITTKNLRALRSLKK